MFLVDIFVRYGAVVLWLHCDPWRAWNVVHHRKMTKRKLLEGNWMMLMLMRRSSYNDDNDDDNDLDVDDDDKVQIDDESVF